MKQLIFLLCWLPMVTSAQENNNGIRWAEGLSWEQVKAKAKAENKYIFLDCYATWCGPCKKMDKEVYSVDSVGDYFNDKFISVKVQMDITKNDNQEVQDWYKDAEQIGKEFRVDGYPTFLFFSPTGVLTDKKSGFSTAGRFLALASRATKPGQIYIDPLARYERLIADYDQGNKQYDSMYYMLKMAREIGEVEKTALLTGDLYKHVSSLPVEALYTPERLDFLQSVTMRSTDKWFPIFYGRPEKVNRVMKDDNYAQRVIDKVILEQVAYPFLKIPPPRMVIGGTGVKADLAEADWTSLEKKISEQFSKYYAKRNVLAARFVWYRFHFNVPAFIDAYMQYLNRYGIDSHEWTKGAWINEFSYTDIFITMNDKVELGNAIKWMKAVVKKDPDYNFMDTYACLLYKAGKKEEALHWERQALQKAMLNEYAASKAEFFRSIITKMEKGEKLHWQN